MEDKSFGQNRVASVVRKAKIKIMGAVVLKKKKTKKKKTKKRRKRKKRRNKMSDMCKES